MKFRLQSLMTVFLAIMFGTAVFVAKDWRGDARFFPWLIAIPGFILALVQMVLELRTARRTIQSSVDVMDIAVDQSVPERTAYKRAARVLGWIIGLYLTIWLVGAQIAALVFFILFLRLEGKAGWLKTILLGVGSFAFLLILDKSLEIFWPEPLIGRWLTLPF